MLLSLANRNLHPFMGALGLACLALLAACANPTGGNTSAGGAGGTGGSGGAGGSGGTGGTGGTGGSGGGYTGGMHWSRAAGSAVQGVAVGKSNHIFVAGTFTGSIDLGNGPIQAAEPDTIFVAELDSEGAPLSSKAFGGDGHAYVSKLVADGQGNLIVSGRFLHTLDLGTTQLSATDEANFVVKLDGSGNVLWAKQIPMPASQTVPQVAANGAGDVVVTGVGDGSIDFGGGAVNLGGAPFIVKYAASGQHVYSRRLTAATSDASSTAGTLGVALAPSGKAVVVGDYSGSPDFGGGALPQSYLGAYLIEVDATGNHVFSSGRDDVATNVAAFDANEDILVGSTLLDWGAPKALEMVKLAGGTGTQLWARTLTVPITGHRYIYGLAVDPAGAMAITGFFAGDLDFGVAHFETAADDSVGDGYVAKLDAQGNPIYAAFLSGPQIQFPYDVALGTNGSLLVVGKFGASIDFDGKSTLQGNDATESGFLAKMVP
jgi:hypothetical protein